MTEDQAGVLRWLRGDKQNAKELMGENLWRRCENNRRDGVAGNYLSQVLGELAALGLARFSGEGYGEWLSIDTEGSAGAGEPEVACRHSDVRDIYIFGERIQACHDCKQEI